MTRSAKGYQKSSYRIPPSTEVQVLRKKDFHHLFASRIAVFLGAFQTSRNFLQPSQIVRKRFPSTNPFPGTKVRTRFKVRESKNTGNVPGYAFKNPGTKGPGSKNPDFLTKVFEGVFSFRKHSKILLTKNVQQQIVHSTSDQKI